MHAAKHCFGTQFTVTLVCWKLQSIFLGKNFAAVIILAIKYYLYLIMIFGKIYSIDNSTIHVSTSTQLLENNGLCFHNFAIQLATLKVN